MKATLAQLFAAAQLAEMAYNADNADHKLEAWNKAKTEYEQAAETERLADLALENIELPSDPREMNGIDLVKKSGVYKALESHNETLLRTVDSLATMNDTLDAENLQVKQERLQLIEENTRLKEANTLLNSQLIEKSQKIDELEKSPLSAKSTVPATAEISAPATTSEGAPAATEAPMTAYQKGLLTKAANQAKAAEEAKKNS